MPWPHPAGKGDYNHGGAHTLTPRREWKQAEGVTVGGVGVSKGQGRKVPTPHHLSQEISSCVNSCEQSGMFPRPRQLSKGGSSSRCDESFGSGYQVPSPVQQSKGGKATQASFRNWERELWPRAIIAQEFAQRPEQSFPPHPWRKHVEPSQIRTVA